MILKIRRPGGWVVIDQVSKIEFDYPSHASWRVEQEHGQVQVFGSSSPKSKKEVWHDVVEVEHLYLNDHTASPKTEDGYLYSYAAHMTRGNMTELVLFDEGYLMNDDGKTIERMNA